MNNFKKRLLASLMVCFAMSNVQAQTGEQINTDTNVITTKEVNELKTDIKDAEAKEENLEKERKRLEKREKNAEKVVRRLERKLRRIERNREDVEKGRAKIAELERELETHRKSNTLSDDEILDINEDILKLKKEILDDQGDIKRIRQS